jgi:hypothetical protein
MQRTHSFEKIYKEVFSRSDTPISPWSRARILDDYFRKYLPSLSSRYTREVEKFIHGDLTYDDMLRVFTRDFFRGTTQDAVAYFLQAYSPWYISSESELPPIRRKPYIREELLSFIDAFGPEQQKSPDRVPGTRVNVWQKITDILDQYSFLY